MESEKGQAYFSISGEEVFGRSCLRGIWNQGHLETRLIEEVNFREPHPERRRIGEKTLARDRSHRIAPDR
jgi:hypothetical protein